jgi:hypothetical protein
MRRDAELTYRRLLRARVVRQIQFSNSCGVSTLFASRVRREVDGFKSEMACDLIASHRARIRTTRWLLAIAQDKIWSDARIRFRDLAACFARGLAGSFRPLA